MNNYIVKKYDVAHLNLYLPNAKEKKNYYDQMIPVMILHPNKQKSN